MRENEDYKCMFTQVRTQVSVHMEMEMKIWCIIKKNAYFKQALDKLEYSC